MNNLALHELFERAPSPDQERAILAPIEGRYAIDAGAGTGKTTTLSYRTVYLIATGTLRPEQLLVVTFTKKAAAEIRDRIARDLDAICARHGIGPFVQGVTCSTIHALAASLLGEFAYRFGYEAPPRAITDGEARAVFAEVLKDAFAGRIGGDASALPIGELKPEPFRDGLASLALRLKQQGITPAAFLEHALRAADALEAQSWGQVWGGPQKPKKPAEPKPDRTAEDRRIEAERERRNARWMTAVFEAFDARLRERHAATYGDLLSLATAMIQAHPPIRAELRARWRHVLVDEFQDTAHAQLAFLHAIFADDAQPERLANAMVVGDFRQAIYGFNGADDRIMLDFSAAADARFPLVTNRRSIEEIVHAAHAILKHRAIVEAHEDPLEAARGRHGGPAIFRRLTDDGVGLTAACVEEEAAAIAAEIARLLAEGTPPAEIAILLRKRTHLHRYVRALTARAIPVAVDRRAGLLDLPEIRDVRAWLRAIVRLDDLPTLVRLLQSPQIATSDAELAALAPLSLAQLLDEPTEHPRVLALRRLLDALLPARSEAAPLAVKRLFAEVPIAASYAAGPAAEQRLANLRAFAALAQRFAADNDDDRLPAFVTYLEASVEHDELLEEADIDVNGVCVLTVHQAKGLEWPIVFAAGADRSTYGHRRVYTPVARDGRTGALVLARDVDDRKTLRGSMLKNSYDPATGERREDAEKREAEREAARLFYVALTRARDRLYVSSPKTEKAYDALAALDGHAHPWPALDGTPAGPTPAAATEPSRVRAVEALLLIPPAEIPPPRVSFTALAAYETCPRLARLRYRLRFPDLAQARYAGGDDDRAPRTDAATFGSLVHRVLELWAQARIDGNAIALDDALAAACAEFADLRDEDRTRAARYATHALAAIADLEVLAAERAFTHRVGGAELYGVIDLVARDAHGTIHVIDYKTGTLVGDEHYAVQLELYARAARAAYPGAEVRARLLRLSVEGADFRDAEPLAPDALERLVEAAGTFRSDVPTPGGHCGACPYNGSPCRDGIARV